VGQVTGQVPGTVGQIGNAAGNVVGGLQPTLQPIGQGVGSALNNLSQPDTVASLLDFLSSVIPNHIEAHVNLDALRVDKLTVDVRGVDLRNLRVDLLVANSRNAGQVRPVLNQGNGGADQTGFRDRGRFGGSVREPSGVGNGFGGWGSGGQQPADTGLRGSSGSGFGGLSTIPGSLQPQAGTTTPTGR
jgi:hypothetical protein